TARRTDPGFRHQPRSGQDGDDNGGSRRRAVDSARARAAPGAQAGHGTGRRAHRPLHPRRTRRHRGVDPPRRRDPRARPERDPAPEVAEFSTGSLKLTMRLLLAQINTVVGDLDGNAERIRGRLAEAKDQQADLVVFPELAVTGYPPEDLLLRPSFVQAAQAKAEALAREARGIVALIGVPWFDRDLYNACAVCAAGEIKTVYRKRFLPNYGVFDEDRYFATGRDLVLLEHGGTLVGPTACEDRWQPGPPATDLALAGAQLLVNLSASPFHVGKDREREEMFAARARDNSAFVALCNMVGGQDELVFDGHSVVLDDEGEVVARAAGFEEALLVVDVDPTAAIGRRLRDVRRRALARDLEHAPAPHPVALE